MAAKDDITALDMFRSRPIENGLLVLCPLAVATLQLLNSYVNDLSYLASIPLAIVLVCFSVLLVQLHRAQFRRRLADTAFSRANEVSE